MTYEIDNPGGGDCGPYSMVTGLIYIIQREYKATGKSKTFQQWLNLGLEAVTLKDILSVDLHKLYHSPRNYKNDLLMHLQMSVRDIGRKAGKEDLFARIRNESLYGSTIIEGSRVFIKFVELVKAYLWQKPSKSQIQEIAKFNELALSPAVNKLAERAASTLSPQLANKTFSERQKTENEQLKKVLLNDVLENGEENPHSVILEGLKKVSKQGHWLTHDDLKDIAVAFDVNLMVVNKLNGVPDPHKSTVTLKNHSNAHWTTIIDQPVPKAVKTARSEKSALPERKESVIASRERLASEHSHKKNPLKRTISERRKPLLTNDSRERLACEHLDKKVKKEHTSAGKTVRLSEKAEIIIAASKSSQIEPEKAERYEQNIRDLVHATVNLGLFANITNKIDIAAINSAQGFKHEKDEDFAARLQEAEIRMTGLK